MNTQIEAIKAELDRIDLKHGFTFSVDPIDDSLLFATLDEPNSFDSIPDPAAALFRLKDIPAPESENDFLIEMLYCILVGEY